MWECEDKEQGNEGGGGEGEEGRAGGERRRGRRGGVGRREGGGGGRGGGGGVGWEVEGRGRSGFSSWFLSQSGVKTALTGVGANKTACKIPPHGAWAWLRDRGEDDMQDFRHTSRLPSPQRHLASWVQRVQNVSFRSEQR